MGRHFAIELLHMILCTDIYHWHFFNWLGLGFWSKECWFED